jgi:hypothetical protein
VFHSLHVCKPVTIPAKHSQILVTLKAEIAIVQVMNFKADNKTLASFAAPLCFCNQASPYPCPFG